MKPEEFELKIANWYATAKTKSLISLCDFLGLTIKRFAEMESKPQFAQTVKNARVLCKKHKRKGNSFWQARASHGRKRIFENPEILFEAALEWFQWIEENPLYETKVFNYKGEITQTEVPKMRAMTIGGLCIFLDCGVDMWMDYRKRDGFSLIMHQIENVMRSQKLTGAAADLLNANIIARELGMVDKTKQELSGPSGGPIEVQSKSLTKEECVAEMKKRGIPIPG